MEVTERHGWFGKRPAVGAVSSAGQSGCAFTGLEQPQLVFSSKPAAPDAASPQSNDDNSELLLKLDFMLMNQPPRSHFLPGNAALFQTGERNQIRLVICS